jgi:membrane-associated phospholipid phosphatase
MARGVSAQQTVILETRVAGRAQAGAVRRSEWVILAFLIYAVAASCLFPVATVVRERIAAINFTLIAVYATLIDGEARRARLAMSVVRDWLPLAAVILAYREMGWFALPQANHAMESHFVAWDRAVLGHGLQALIEAAGAVLPALLEIAYSLVYTLAPFAVATLYLMRRRELVDRFLFVFVVSVLLCYAQFPFWPSEPPRALFPGQDLPAYDTVFRHFNLWMLGGYGIHTSVFPSAHVAGAFAAALGMRHAAPDKKWVYRLLIVLATLIAVATVYGRYHYVADAAAGFLIATLTAAAAETVALRRTKVVTSAMAKELV